MRVLHLLLGAALLAVAVVFVNKGKVQNRSRAAGVSSELDAFLDWWDLNGEFDITISPDGGLRTDAAKQAQYFANGTSKARTLDQTAHGRAGAIDVQPVSYDPTRAVDADTYALFETIGRAGEAFGLVWGGRWSRAYPPSTGNPYGGDLAHLEVEDWASLPYPPDSARNA